MLNTASSTIYKWIVAASATFVLSLLMPTGAFAQVTAFKQSVAEAAARDDDIARFYRANNFEGIWTGDDRKDKLRRQALFQAIDEVSVHGIPSSRYDAPGLLNLMKSVRTPRDLGKVEVEMSRVFLRLARDVQTGILVPTEIDEGMRREVLYRDRASNLVDFTKSNPRSFFRALAPKSSEYSRLMKERNQLENLLAKGGWGPKVQSKSLKPGDSGNSVIALRNRLTAMGFLKRSSSKIYDTKMELAVQSFQNAHGLVADGAAGAGTIQELNKSVEDRLKSVMVAMERERWLNMPRGKRHVLVNLTDFAARIIDDDKVTFKTRAVVGKNVGDRRSPEFSDEMEHMIINPTWHVPRSIVVKEYLPQMQRNPGAAGHLKLYNASGKQVSRANIDFSSYNSSNFPFEMKQPPSSRNALGLVKFMFPNKHNIYLHDTPSKSLFQRNKRDFSHGCIRLHQPFDFAYAILAKQESNPKRYFDRILNTGQRTQVDLDAKIPVHIIYRTAYTQAKGPTQYRNDVYGRDAKIWKALTNAGVSLRAVRG